MVGEKTAHLGSPHVLEGHDGRGGVRQHLRPPQQNRQSRGRALRAAVVGNAGGAQSLAGSADQVLAHQRHNHGLRRTADHRDE